MDLNYLENGISGEENPCKRTRKRLTYVQTSVALFFMDNQAVNNIFLTKVNFTTIIFLLSCILISCNNNKEPLTAKEFIVVQDSVRRMTELIARDVSREGPVAWLRYFENSSGFFMASEGQLVFPNNDSATSFIRNKLVKSINKINLRWNNLRIDPLTPKLAGISAAFHEEITGFDGRKKPEDGYFTGIAQQTRKGWQLRNAHWSLMVTK
jgi:hypothetical protein